MCHDPSLTIIEIGGVSFLIDSDVVFSNVAITNVEIEKKEI